MNENNLSENNNLNKALKSTIIVITLLIIISATLIVVALVKRKSESNNQTSNNNIQNIISLEENFPANCLPIDITYKETYIALQSKKCNIIKIIDLSKNKRYKVQF